jgi:opacity protein-like surface antigen
MYKIFLITLLTVSLSYANKSYSFLGAQTSFVNYDDVSGSSLGLKYGIQRGMWRSSLNLDYSENDSNKLGSFILQVDKGILKKYSKNSPLKPHLGFSFGLLQHEKEKTDKGYGFGLNGGLTYIVNDAIDLDLSYRYLNTTKMNQIGSLHHINLSLHYFY